MRVMVAGPTLACLRGVLGGMPLRVEAGEPKNMKNSIIVGAIVIVTILAPQAAAGSAGYNADFLGLPVGFNIAGSLTSFPMIDNDKGVAVVSDAVFNPLTERWIGHIKCVVPESEDELFCTGTVSSVD